MSQRITTPFINFTGLLQSKAFPSLFLLGADGRTALISNVEGIAACDEVVHLETYSITRSIETPSQDAARLFKDLLVGRRQSIQRCALEWGVFSVLYEDVLRGCFAPVQLCDATETLLTLRKRKEDDEIASVRDSLQFCTVAYRSRPRNHSA